MPLSPFTLDDLLYRLGPLEQTQLVLWGQESDFPRLLAFNPLETYQGRFAAGIEDFLKRHQGRLVAFALAYDHLDAGPGGETSFFAAYDNWLEFPASGVCLHKEDPAWEEQIEGITNRRLPREKEIRLWLEPGLSFAEFLPKFQAIQSYIQAGDFYQINFTQRLQGSYPGTSQDLFFKLLKANQPRYGCFLQTPRFDLLGMSPESFLQTQGRRIFTRPIKGTAADQGTEALRALWHSPKEEAELNMITDLLRNDLAKSCEPGTVKVNKHRELLKLRGVVHAFSEVEGRLKPGVSPLQAMLNAFPGGSVTGCPKRRAKEVIQELETAPRGFYTGAYGFIDPQGGLHAAVTIRSFFKQGQNLDFHVGGGITALSDPQAEWDEMHHKRHAITQGLE